jgi:RNA polymerase sigma factor (sigma-70 family)
MLGERSAWDALVSRYSRLVWSVARSFRLSEPDVEDVCQTTWLRFVEHLGSIRDPDRLAGWLATTARREAITLLRKRIHDTSDLIEDSTDEYTVRFAPSAEATAIARDEYQALWSAFNGLSERCRSLLRVLAVSPTENYAQIARELNMPVESIGPTRARCIDRLRAQLALVGEGRAGEVGGRRGEWRGPVTPASSASVPAGPARLSPQAGVTYRIGFDVDTAADRPWAWPRDEAGRALPVRVLVVAEGARVRPLARLIAPDADVADTAFELTPAATGPVTVRVLVYYEAESIFLEEAVGVISHAPVGSPEIVRARIE